MPFPCRLAGFSPLLLIVLLAACGDDGGTDVSVTPSPAPSITAAPTSTATPATTATVTPSASPSSSPTATPSPSPEAEAPHAAPIELDPGVTSLAENVQLAVLQPKASHNLDPVALAEGMGITTPPCAALVFYLSWQVRSPYPPTDVDIEVYWMRQGGKDLLGEGPSGQVSSGCGEFQVVNNSDVWVTVEVRYVIGKLAG